VLGSCSSGIEQAGSFGGIGLTFTANALGRNGTGITVTNLTESTISKNDVSGNSVGVLILNLDVTGPPLILSHNIINGTRVMACRSNLAYFSSTMSRSRTTS